MAFSAKQFEIVPVKGNIWIAIAAVVQMVDVVDDHAGNVSTGTETALT